MAEPAPPSPSGIWLGTLDGARGRKFRLQLQLDLASTPPRCTMDSVDEGEFGAPCANVVVTGTSLSLGLPSHGAKLTGTVSTARNTVSASWTSASHPAARPLLLVRQASAIEPPKPAPANPAMPPVDIAGLQAVMDYGPRWLV